MEASMSQHTISPDALRHVCPNLSPADAARIAAGLGEAFHRYGIDTDRRAAMAVAQWAHESDRFKTSQEYASGSAYEGRKDLGNTQRGDGVRFKGRGRIMVTGRSNYAAMGKALGLDLIGRPDVLAESPHSELASGQWWKDHDCNGFCDRDDFVGLTRRINGGVNGLADRQALYARAREVARDLVPRDPWAVLTDEERTQMELLESKRRVAKRNGGWDKIDASHREQAKRAKAWLVARRTELERLAKQEPGGWEKAGRRKRCDLIKAATND
jgi:predicted chitinase